MLDQFFKDFSVLIIALPVAIAVLSPFVFIATGIRALVIRKRNRKDRT